MAIVVKDEPSLIPHPQCWEAKSKERAGTVRLSKKVERELKAVVQFSNQFPLPFHHFHLSITQIPPSLPAMAELKETYACIPSTERGRGILISGDPKSNSILYCNGRSVIIRYLDRPLQVAVYGEHAYQATVARYSPNGEWIASADVSGTVRIWGTHNDFVLKKEFRVLSGRIDDLQWSPDGLRIVASGDGKGKSLVRAFMLVSLLFFLNKYFTGSEWISTVF